MTVPRKKKPTNTNTKHQRIRSTSMSNSNLGRATYCSPSTAIENIDQCHRFTPKSTTTSIHFLFLEQPLQLVLVKRLAFSSSRIRSDLTLSDSAKTVVVETRSSNRYVSCLADKFRHGGLTDDGLSYEENFIVRCCEVGPNRTATVETIIANLLQVIDC